jgi:hypothetical protein
MTVTVIDKECAKMSPVEWREICFVAIYSRLLKDV